MIIKFQGKYIVYEGTYTATYKVAVLNDCVELGITIGTSEKSDNIRVILLEHGCESLEADQIEKLNEVADNYLARCLKDGYLNTNHFKRYLPKCLERGLEE